ncbi:hypothetical protein BDK51DRAFT_53083 [Blyttiomyces helicus]|uniref:Uncharacterized protein n=1 Tax=Blyttiomyces helicus TaxID=388810 RepID=A0A4P9W6B1_9FUNG|nr:hypothetical protein BDK51DRAFT_53083 [Blyttiomyces helicus]|eukprot:RKO87844.1 hypothetical protein BDK51DRAFT_53083 [Blyttiomyces helicus]
MIRNTSQSTDGSTDRLSQQHHQSSRTRSLSKDPLPPLRTTLSSLDPRENPLPSPLSKNPSALRSPSTSDTDQHRDQIGITLTRSFCSAKSSPWTQELGGPGAPRGSVPPRGSRRTSIHATPLIRTPRPPAAAPDVSEAPREWDSLAGSAADLVDGAPEKVGTSPRERWARAIEAVLERVRTVRAFARPIVVEADGKEESHEQPSLTASRIGFNMEEYRVNRKRFALRLSSNLRKILTKLPEEVTSADDDILYGLTTVLPMFAKYDASMRRELTRVLKYEVFEAGRTIVREVRILNG